MDTLKQSLELMKGNGEGVVKLIGINLLVSMIYIPLFIISIFFPPILLLIMLFTTFYGIFHIQAYRIWFLENQHATMKELFQASFESFKKNGLRYFGVSCLIGLLFVAIILLCVFIMFGSLFVGESIGLIAFVMSNFVLFMLFVTFLTLFMYFPQYIYGFIALGVTKATKKTFANWKNIFLCGLIFTGLQFVPIVGTLASIVFNFIMPLKIILDSEVATNETMTYKQNYSYSDEC